jgi:hypothetical protein
VLCWLSSRPCLCVFSAFDSGVLLTFFFLSFLSFFLFLCSFFLRFSHLPLGQQPRLLYSLYRALLRKQILH